MNNLPPGYSDWMLEPEEHYDECLELPEGSECICADIEEVREDDRINNMVDEYLMEQAESGVINAY